MINIFEYDILGNAICTLREVSVDNHNGTNFYMSESPVPVVNFDTVKNQYILGLSVPEPPASNDAFFVDNQGELYFIEFKAGNMERNIHQVRRKLFDSLLVLTDIISKGVSFTREHLNYILVYDETINPGFDDNTAFQVTPSRERINSRYIKKGGGEFIRFHLRRFQRLYVKCVYTVGREEFDERFARIWEADILL